MNNELNRTTEQEIQDWASELFEVWRSGIKRKGLVLTGRLLESFKHEFLPQSKTILLQMNYYGKILETYQDGRHKWGYKKSLRDALENLQDRLIVQLSNEIVRTQNGVINI